MKLVIFACLASVAFTAPQRYYQPQYQTYTQPQYQTYSQQAVIPIVSETNELNADGSYSYSYVTGDGQQVQAQGYLKNAGLKGAEGEAAQGSYSYTAPDGTPISVTWIADENGFRAEGAHLPTPPPTPIAIQRALDLIAQKQISIPQQQVFIPQQQRYRF